MRANFNEPYPRLPPGMYSEYKWPQGEETRLESGPPTLVLDMVQILRTRQTRRIFNSLSLSDLGKLLWLTCRTHSSRSSVFGFDQHFRPHPSAGAMHPIHIICQRNPSMPWERYHPVEHKLISVTGTEALAQDARDFSARIVPSEGAVLIGLVAEAGKTAAKYNVEHSLVWRDAGVVLGYLSLIAETLQLSFCPLGITGNAFVMPISNKGQLQGAGLALIGS